VLTTAARRRDIVVAEAIAQLISEQASWSNHIYLLFRGLLRRPDNNFARK
jgi:hypothetical protein